LRGLDPRIHVAHHEFHRATKTRMAGSSPAIVTTESRVSAGFAIAFGL